MTLWVPVLRVVDRHVDRHVASTPGVIWYFAGFQSIAILAIFHNAQIICTVPNHPWGGGASGAHPRRIWGAHFSPGVPTRTSS